MPYKDPDRRRAYARDYRRLRRAGDTGSTPVHPVIPLPTRLRTAADVIELLREQVGLVRADPSMPAGDRARTVGFLCGVALRAIEAGNLAARIEALETVLNQRKENQRDDQ